MKIEMEQTFGALLLFFKALADANRLKLIGLVAQKESSVEELAAVLDINPSTVSHHLSKLDVILSYLAEQFEFNRTYTEKEVNNVIERFNDAISGLRRDLIPVRLLARECYGSAYWRVHPEE